ncbi:nucleoid occlusion protein, partial [Listeria seeligeri]|nr:nucleoid occlusion protein [Listeria seeligeri]
MPFSRLFGKKEKNQMDDIDNIVEEGVQRVQELPMDKIFPNQFQPRTVF